ncbi:MAG: VWA domain-containing protein, partial [Candidatus Thorarchaeota archaeon]
LFLRDISWSISSFKNQYAEMLIILLQSLSRFKYVRTASIDFGEYAKITKKFDDKIPNISPISDGTTNLTAALNIASTDKSVMFKSKNKLLIILTDGEPNSIRNVYEELEKEYFNNNVRILPIIIRNDDVYFIKNQIHINEISEMPLKIFDFVKDNFRIEVNI